MIVVNLYAGPGAGKSSLAAGVFATLKWQGVRCELVTEFAKDLTWEKRDVALADQVYVFAKQLHRLNRLRGQVDVAVTDSPLLLSMIYGNPSGPLKALVLDSYHSFSNFDVYVVRQKEYQTEGRNQTEEEAKLLDLRILDMVNHYCGRVPSVAGKAVSVGYLAEEVMCRLRRTI